MGRGRRRGPRAADPARPQGAPSSGPALHGGRARGHSLQATALVNEAYLRLVDAKAVRWHDRAHFLAVSARVMRRILVDHARARRTRKRGGDGARVTFDEELVVTDEPRQDVIALDDALAALAKFDERKSRVVELRFFGGLSVEETASVLGVYRRTSSAFCPASSEVRPCR